MNQLTDIKDVTNRQKEIIQAAIKIISRMGYKELTTRNLANELKLTEAALYRHFRSKNDLVQSILNYFSDVSLQILNSIKVEGLEAWERVELFIMNRFEVFNANPDLGSVIFSEELFKNDRNLMQHMRGLMYSHKQQIKSYLAQAQDQGVIRAECDIEQVFRVVIGSMRFTVTNWVMNDFASDLVEEGRKLIQTLRTLIIIKNN